MPWTPERYLATQNRCTERPSSREQHIALVGRAADLIATTAIEGKFDLLMMARTAIPPSPTCCSDR